MRTGTCEGDSSGSRDTPGHGVIQCCQPRAGWLQRLALHTQWWLPLSPLSVPHSRESLQGHRAGLSVATRGWGTAQCQLRAVAAPWAGDSLPSLGDLSRVTPVSVQANGGTARPALPLSSTSVLPPGMSPGWGTGR